MLNAADLTQPAEAIRRVIAEDWRKPVPPALPQLAEWLRARHGATVGAVLFYGSCLRSGSDRDGILDLYLLVDSYRESYPGRRLLAAANRMLPPNVFYAEMPESESMLRVKYAVMSFADFFAAAGPRALLPAIWARFSQPTALVWSRDGDSRGAVEAALVQAIATMALRTAPLIEGEADAVRFWRAGYARSYRAEARVEGAERAASLVQPLERYRALLIPALQLAAVPFAEARPDRVRILLDDRARKDGERLWQRAALATRLHTIPRLAKAACTFEGGIDYALWKVERHSGVRVEASPWQRRHPLMAALPLVWRAWRQGAFRRV